MYTEAERPQTTADRLLGALALGDSALPIGRFVHSGGLEAWLGEQPNVGSERLRELIRAMICEGAAPLDARGSCARASRSQARAADRA